MKTWRFREFGKLEFEDVPMHVVEPGWVQVKVKSCTARCDERGFGRRLTSAIGAVYGAQTQLNDTVVVIGYGDCGLA